MSNKCQVVGLFSGFVVQDKARYTAGGYHRHHSAVYILRERSSDDMRSCGIHRSQITESRRTPDRQVYDGGDTVTAVLPRAFLRD